MLRCVVFAVCLYCGVPLYVNEAGVGASATFSVSIMTALTYQIASLLPQEQ